MAAEIEPFAPGSTSLIQDESCLASWTPLFWKKCTFDRDIFVGVMNNLILNPNINSSWLFRADILLEQQGKDECQGDDLNLRPIIVHFKDFYLDRFLIRKLIPRNPQRDSDLDQTCLFYQSKAPNGVVSRTLVVYKPHSSQSDMPFYHPKVQGIAYLHEWNHQSGEATISTHYQYFSDLIPDAKLTRTGLYLLSTLSKHGEGRNKGYVKRVIHDTIIPQIALQSTYTRLKKKYARRLIQEWAEVTDPTKHVFEDLGIASFLIELWAQMYRDCEFPGFVDIGCGNGLLVYILRAEGYSGWGFDARQRKSWNNYNDKIDAHGNGKPKDILRQLVLLPSILQDGIEVSGTDEELAVQVHDGIFPRGTFIVSNHADELTPWTPILAAVSDCPFIMIPCCSHDLSGARFRAAAPKDKGKSPSAYSSLVEWVKQLAVDCNWAIETEMMRIPTTRNTGIVGRRRIDETASVNIPNILSNYGGTGGYVENVLKLVKTSPRGH
ncbi:hypothetical protein GGR57DRAFT_473753 [Xylariaceae sp. FL1272]|nr:hypothetical protein GGR57DRAFT_473753 [Xylariaceae sp. FL1272]